MKRERRPLAGRYAHQPLAGGQRPGAGLGEHPRAQPAPGIDAYAWLWPPGVSDGSPTPSQVRGFRQALLDLRRKTPALGQAMYAQMDSVYSTILPGYFPGTPDVPGAVYFVIGNEKQFAAYEKYLQSAVAPNTVLHRLYPRDFWPEPEKEAATP